MDYSDDVCRFLKEHQLEEYLHYAIHLVQGSFSVARDLQVEFVVDPECDESWLSIRFVTEGSLDDIIAARKRYRRFWVRNVPVTKRLMIRLMYDIA